MGSNSWTLFDDELMMMMMMIHVLGWAHHTPAWRVPAQPCTAHLPAVLLAHEHTQLAIRIYIEEADTYRAKARAGTCRATLV